MRELLSPSNTRRFLTEAAGVRRYHRSAARALAAARGGVLWVPLCTGWTCNPDRVARALASFERSAHRF